MNFLYYFLFVVYFYSNKIWCIEKLVLQYTIKLIDFTGTSISQSTTHTYQHYLFSKWTTMVVRFVLQKINKFINL